MRSHIDRSHALRIAFPDALNVHLHYTLETRPQNGVEGIPILVQGWNGVFMAQQTILVNQMNAEEQRYAVVTFRDALVHVFLQNEGDEFIEIRG